MSDFVTDTLAGALGALEERRRKIQPFLNEADELDRAIKEQRKLLGKLGIDPGARPAQSPASASPAAAPAAAPPRDGTNADRILKLLRDHPRGLNTAVISREAQVAQGSISVVLNQLVGRGLVVKVGRGFWRIAAAEPRLAAV